jgi:hypothetical protein
LLLVAAGLTGLMFATSTLRVALAHENREVGEYEFTVGFLNEPAYEGLLNAVSLRIVNAESEEPIEGAEETVQVEVTHPETGSSQTMAMRTVFGDLGHYRADFVPTLPGTYQFRFFGAVGDLQIDELFESGEGTFSSIGVIADLQFPEQVASAREIQGAASGARTIALDAEDAASSAQTMAYVGIGAGVVGILMGAAGVAMAVRRR